MTRLRQVLDELLAITPQPPGESDVVELLEAAAQMVQAREQPLAALATIPAAEFAGDPEAAQLLELLNDRDLAWEAELGRARFVVLTRMSTARRQRHG
jgi:hypothetical protein